MKARQSPATTAPGEVAQPSAVAPNGRVCVAQIGRPHGTRGELRFYAFTEDPLAVGAYGPLSSEDRRQSLLITALRRGPHGLIAAFAGVGDRQAAQRLSGLRLYVERSQLPALDDPESYYHADLIGLAALSAEGVKVGMVCAVHDFGAGAILEIAAEQGRSVMVPFSKAAVPTIELAAGRLVLAAGALQATAPAPRKGTGA